MTGRVILTEYQDVTLDLAEADVALFQGPLRKRFTINRALAGPGYTINPGSTVGVVRLPSGTQLDIRPKVPLRNLLWMLAVVEDMTEIDFHRLDELVDLKDFDELLEIVAETFANMVERRIDLGLYRNYVEEEGNLPTVRGRILFNEDITHNAVLRHRTWCRYTTYSWDLPENQVIRQVCRQLAGWGFSSRLSSRFIALDHQMDEISPSRLHAADVDRFTYTRQSDDYRAIHRYCRFFLDGASLNEDAGDIGFDGFLLDMNKLFEKFITCSLQPQLEPPFRLTDQMQDNLDTAGTVVIRPDLVLSHAGVPILIGDCKYKKMESTDHKHSDLYQILAYCISLDVTSGVLVYPRHNTTRDDRIDVRHSPISIRETSIDLSGTIDDVRVETALLASRMRTWADPLPLPIAPSKKQQRRA